MEEKNSSTLCMEDKYVTPWQNRVGNNLIPSTWGVPPQNITARRQPIHTLSLTNFNKQGWNNKDCDNYFTFSTCREFRIVNIHAKKTVFWSTVKRPNTQVKPSKGRRTTVAFSRDLKWKNKSELVCPWFPKYLKSSELTRSFHIM